MKIRDVPRALIQRALSFATPASARSSWVFGARGEPFPGAWQQNVQWTPESVLASPPVFACVTRIAQDVAKLRFVLQEFKSYTTGPIWQETFSPAFSPVLRKPNPFQTHIQFKESWMLSKLTTGNSYVFKNRDERNVVVGLYPLDPRRCWPVVTASGDVYYEIGADNLSRVGPRGIVVPASEIIHDRFNCLFHPLVGLSPIFAAGLSGAQAQAIIDNSAAFFANGSNPSGILTVPKGISDAQAAKLKAAWDEFRARGAGGLAVIEEAMKYEPTRMTAVDSQLIEFLKMDAEMVCSAFHVPPYKVGIGQLPTQTNIEALGIQYVEECLQTHIEAMEACMDDGLSLLGSVTGYGVALDIEGLTRMDTTSKMNALSVGAKAGLIKPNEGRQKLDLPPVEGGDTPYLQQQNFSLAALAKRDASEDPFSNSQPAAPTAPTAPGQATDAAGAAAEDAAAAAGDVARVQVAQLVRGIEDACAGLIVEVE